MFDVSRMDSLHLFAIDMRMFAIIVKMVIPNISNLSDTIAEAYFTNENNEKRHIKFRDKRSII